MVSLSITSLNTHRSVRSPLAAEQLRPPPAPAASALYPDARGNERERLMGRIPRPTVGPLKNSITASKPPAPAAAAKSMKTATRATGSWLAPAVPARASRALRRPESVLGACNGVVDGQHPHVAAVEERPHRRPEPRGQAPIGGSGRWRPSSRSGPSLAGQAKQRPGKVSDQGRQQT